MRKASLVPGILLACAILSAPGCGGGGGKGPTAPLRVNNSMAVVVDMRSSFTTKPAFELRIDGELVASLDYTQSSTDCKGGFFGKCAIGASVQNVDSGQHVARVTLVDQAGPISIWEFDGVVQVTSTSPVLKESVINLESKTSRLHPGGFVQWSFHVNL